ncbi:MAG: secondary thiamine-phosphate synthase enzyme YjbQ [Azonexus sp.]|nr:YjbQ family protein [Betaproteobacteria bacterium]MBK8919596.1 YjbQ family protein [Betaproteobacteria bacterium]MBP6034837.1 secondary thiamine-phosphate synthase enzyme YjbQ [Azonexus sp.]MBP6905543.1 secondary thiamine-phosphate synthase enzyme YjbQ [Azonexus sp.]
MTYQEIFAVQSRGRGTQNLTAEIRAAVGRAGIATGLVHVFVRHTSCSLLLTENADPDVRRDLETLFARLVPDGDPAYRHDLEGEDDMAAHARSLLAGHELSVPVADGALLLGTWQGVFLWEHRATGHRREIVVTVIG